MGIKLKEMPEDKNYDELYPQHPPLILAQPSKDGSSTVSDGDGFHVRIQTDQLFFTPP